MAAQSDRAGPSVGLALKRGIKVDIKTEQVRMDPNNEIRGWLVCGPHGHLAGTFGLSLERVARKFRSLNKRAGFADDAKDYYRVHTATLHVYGCSSGTPNRPETK